MVVEHSVEIDRPFDEVWAIFNEPALQPEWLDMMKSFEQVKGKGNAEGAVQSVVFTRDSGDTELTVTVLKNDGAGHIVTRYEGMQLPFVLTSTFSAAGDDSTQWHAEIEVKLSLLQKALAPILSGAMRELAENMGDDFKRFVESR